MKRMALIFLCVGIINDAPAAEFPEKNYTSTQPLSLPAQVKLNPMDLTPPVEVPFLYSPSFIFDKMDDLAQYVIRQFHPEFQSASGINEMDGKAIAIHKNHNAHWKKILEDVIQVIEAESSVCVSSHQDQKSRAYVAQCFKYYDQLIDQNHRHKRLSLFIPLNYSDTQDLIDPISFIFNNIQALVLKDAPVEARTQRLKGYLFASNGCLSLCHGVQKELRTMIDWYKGEALYPSYLQLEDIIKHEKIGEFKAQMAEWFFHEPSLALHFNRQVDGYISFVKMVLMPKARRETELPFEIYNLMLKINGVNQTPLLLVKQGTDDYDIAYEKFMAIGNEIAVKKVDSQRYPLDKPGVVLQSLMTDTALSTQAEIVDMYQKVQKDLESIMRENSFITLPERSLRMRAGTSAEESSFPVPHVNTPSFINNTGLTEASWPEFVLCDIKGNASPVGAYALCAHEGRPGHDLQFSRMVEESLKGNLNLFETVLASNSTNAEGWAHYVEYAMATHFTPEAQLGALQDQLLRMSRMFLDPLINLGVIKHQYVVDFLMGRLGISESMAKSEANRYSFLMPGQAVTYRHGALQIMNLRDNLKEKMGDKFRQQEFHDHVLSYGLLPMELVKDWITDIMIV